MGLAQYLSQPQDHCDMANKKENHFKETQFAIIIYGVNKNEQVTKRLLYTFCKKSLKDLTRVEIDDIRLLRR